jgi:hypothetical protein
MQRPDFSHDRRAEGEDVRMNIWLICRGLVKHRLPTSIPTLYLILVAGNTKIILVSDVVVGAWRCIEKLRHLPETYNIHENVRAFIFESVLDWCYRKEGVIDQKGQTTPKSGRLSGKSGYLMSK